MEERETDSVVVWRRSDTAESDLAEAGQPTRLRHSSSLHLTVSGGELRGPHGSTAGAGHDQLLLATRGEVLYGGADGKMRTLTAPGTFFVPPRGDAWSATCPRHVHDTPSPPHPPGTLFVPAGAPLTLSPAPGAAPPPLPVSSNVASAHLG